MRKYSGCKIRKRRRSRLDLMFSTQFGGTCIQKEELTKVVEIAKRHHKWIISDEIHCDIVQKMGLRTILWKRSVPELCVEEEDDYLICAKQDI